jgi:hypothetical protein
MRSFAHWTPRYIKDRLALVAYERANPDQPWLTRSMIGILETWLKPADVGLEFGSGRSTGWFGARVAHLTSVEHDATWFNIVERKVAAIRAQVDCFLHEDGISHSAESAYVLVGKRTAPSSLDFCLIDGVARDHCALACLDKLKAGGILIIDNVNWYIPRERRSFAPSSRGPSDGYASEVWHQVGQEISGWRNVWTSDGVTDTAFWVRPE